MDCQQVRHVVEEYRAGSLPGRMGTAVRNHLVRCGACRDFYAAADTIGRLVSALPRVPAPENFEALLYRRLNEQLDIPRRPGRSFPRQALLLVATLLLALGVTVIYRSVDWTSSPEPVGLRSESAIQDIPVMEIPLEPELYAPGGNEYIRFISKDRRTGEDVFVQMPASYRIQDFQAMENVYLHEVSH